MEVTAPTPTTEETEIAAMAAKVRELVKPQALASGVVNCFTRERIGLWELHNRSERERIFQAVFDVYENRTGKFFEHMPESNLEDGRRQPGRVPLNPLKNWIDTWCTTYDVVPTRTFFYKGEEAEGPSNDALQDRYRQAQVDRVMAKIDRWLRLVGNAALVPFYDADWDELVLHGYPSQQVRVIENNSNPARPRATAVVGFDQNVTPEIGDLSRAVMAEAWLTPRKDRFARVSLHGDTMGMESKFNDGAPPLVHCFDSMPDVRTGYYVPCAGPMLAALVMLLQNDFWNSTGFTTIMQNFGILQVFGLAEGEKVNVSPGSAIKFQGDPNRREGAEFANARPELAATLEVIAAIEKNIRRDNNIPETMFDVTVDASGAAIIQARGPAAEMRNARLATFRQTETQLLHAIGSELKRAGVREFANFNPADWDVSVAYAESVGTVSVQDQMAQEKHDLEIGITEPAEILMARAPDKYDSLKDARKKVAELRMAGGKTADSYRMTNALNAGVRQDAGALYGALGAPIPAGTPAVIEPPPKVMETQNSNSGESPDTAEKNPVDNQDEEDEDDSN